MNNQTASTDFHLLAFSGEEDKHSFLSIFFFLMYVIGILGNIIIITVVYVDIHLHKPMYIFLCNLSIVDICFTTVTLPKLMDILLTGNNSISFVQCFTQMYFFVLLCNTEIILLSFMAYDRYVAIGKPLHYHLIMNTEKCVQILGCTWLSGFLNSFFLTGFASTLNFCHARNLRHFYCEIKSLAKVACADVRFHVIFLVETLLFGFFPFILSLTSYIKIISTVLRVKSSDSRKKAFSTCTSHLTVLLIFYGTILCVYLRPPTEHSEELDQAFTVLYAAVTPMLNPLIYSLKNKEVKSALIRILKEKTK